MTGKKRFIESTTLCFLLLALAPTLHALNETHLNKSEIPNGCSSCHKGHGRRGTSMLDKANEELCFKCHGPVKRGIRGEAGSDLYSVSLKRSNHPVVRTAKYHVPGEILPERSTGAPRHVACADCHNPHLSTRNKPIKGARGYSGRGVQVKEAQHEYELCYRCHSDSANLPPDSANLAQKFDSGNASYHPVEAQGKNGNVPSLVETLSPNSMIKCSDCHGNDDKAGPAGPHGSNYAFLLKENYIRESGPESPFAYELCYGCHRRDSILNDASFKAHKRHVLFGGVSCHACHDSHGSRDFEFLLEFDSRIVSPNSQGQLGFFKLAAGRPRCFLSCHVGGTSFDHKITDFQYCINTDCPPGW